MAKWFILLLFTYGCYNSKKAIQDTSKAIINYPEAIAKVTRDRFPCVPTKSDTITITNDSLWQETVNQLSGELWTSFLLQDSLMNELSKDSGCVKYAVIVSQLKKDNQQLTEKLKTIPVVTKTITIEKKTKDSSDIYILNAENKRIYTSLDKALTIATDKTKESDRWRRIAKQRFWIIFGMGTGILLWLAGFIRRKIK